MTCKCPRCSARNHTTAAFCARCGLSLAAGPDAAGRLSPSAWRHPDPLRPPAGFRPVEGLPDLCFRWQAVWGGAVLLGTESLAVILFNGGYPLDEPVVRVSGRAADGREVFAVTRSLATLPRGAEVTIEVPSYEVHAPASDIAVSLLSGRIASVS